MPDVAIKPGAPPAGVPAASRCLTCGTLWLPAEDSDGGCPMCLMAEDSPRYTPHPPAFTACPDRPGPVPATGKHFTATPVLRPGNAEYAYAANILHQRRGMTDGKPNPPPKADYKNEATIWKHDGAEWFQIAFTVFGPWPDHDTAMRQYTREIRLALARRRQNEAPLEVREEGDKDEAAELAATQIAQAVTRLDDIHFGFLAGTLDTTTALTLLSAARQDLIRARATALQCHPEYTL